MDRSPSVLRSTLDLQYFRRPKFFLRRTWWLAFLLALLPIAGVAYTYVTKDRVAFTAGQLSTPHIFIQNDCQRCHDTWAPVERVASLGESSTIGNSIHNEGCQKCHQAPAHHANQVPAHESLSCAACHVEHRGDALLTQVGDHTCRQCHTNLLVTENDKLKPSASFWKHVGSFNPVTQVGGHPDFAIHRLPEKGKSDNDPLKAAMISSKHRVFELMAGKIPIRSGKRAGQTADWGDATNLAFSHASHIFLKMDRDNDGLLVGQRDPKTREIPHTQELVEANCLNCHKKAPDGKTMLPIVYEQHCQGCHPLAVDLSAVTHAPPAGSVKLIHERPDILRGYLLNQVTAPRADAQPKDPPNGRPVPGPEALPLADFLDTTNEITSQIRQIEHTLFGKEADGGCRYCHTVKPPAPKDGLLGEWSILPPNIPDVWLPHSRFSHESHRFLNCLTCHDTIGRAEGDGDKAAVTALSDSVSDVNIPKVEACFGCHAQSAAGRQATSLHAKDTGPVPTRCIDCHNFHSRK